MAGMDIINYYADLGIEDENADEATIKKAYRKLVLKWHPDKHPENRDEAETQIRKINNAYEVLSNPTKRSTYDDQRRAVKRKKQGFGPPPPSGAPRMRIPKEFMMMPIGFPDRFVRYNGRRLFVQRRKDDPDVEFKAFFEDTKWSLWWLPEVNNMCRVRALGSKAAGEKMGVAAGLCGGLNLSFFIDPASPTDSEVGLEDARKGEKVDKVNFVAVTSPAYEGAFRFEAAYRRGFYLTFLPPNHLRVAPYGEEDDRGIADFALVDFGVMFKFIEMEEVLQPAVAAYKGGVKLEQLRKDPNILLYFSNILQKPVWDNEDFIIYFEGHWETWEFNKDTQSVRLRTKEEKLAQMLATVKDIDGVSAVVAGAKDELTKLPLLAAARALVVLAASTHDGEGLDVTKTINRIAAQKKLLSNLRSILATATNGGEVVLPLNDLLDMADLAGAVGGTGAASDLVHTRQAAQQAVADIVFRQLADGKSQLDVALLGRVLRLPGAGEVDSTLASMCQPLVASVGLEQALEFVRRAGSSSCVEVANTYATSALLMMDTKQPEPSAEEQLEILRTIASAGAALEDISGRLARLAPVSQADVLVDVVLAIAERGFSSDALATATQVLATKLGSTQLQPTRLLDLAVASTKSTSLAPVIGAVARAVGASATMWPVSDLVRLLLAMAKAKKALNTEDKAYLLKQAAEALKSELGSLPAADVIKLVLATAGDGCSELLEAAAEEAVDRRISVFPPAQLLMLSQGLVTGLGSKHGLVAKLVDFWSETLKEWTKGAGGAWDSDDEVTKQRRELEKKSRLSADQVVQLAKVMAVGSKSLTEAIGGNLVARAKELTENGRKAVDAQIVDGALATYSRKDRLKRAVAAAAGSNSRSRSRRPTTWQTGAVRALLCSHRDGEVAAEVVIAVEIVIEGRPDDAFQPTATPHSMECSEMSALEVLKLKPTAGKYDFKDKIADLQAMICPLKNALSDQRLKAKALEEALAAAEQDVNARLCSSKNELKEAAAQLASVQKEAAGREALLATQLSEESNRVLRLGQDIEKARASASAQAEEAAAARRRCEDMSDRHRRQMEEVATTLRRQVDEAMQAKEQLVEAHRRKEAALLADYNKAKDALQHEHQHRLKELEEALQSKDSEAAKALQQLEEVIHAKDVQLQEQEQQAKDCLANAKDHHAAVIADMQRLQKEKEEELHNAIESLKEAHRSALDRREATFKSKEAELNELVEHLTATHQLQMSEKEQDHKLKEDAAEATLCALKQELADKEHHTRQRIETLMTSHEDSERSFRKQEKQMKEALREAKTKHEALMEEKETSFRQATDVLQQQLRAKEMTLHETLQSLQFLRDSTSEQLQWERHRTESELARMRDQLQELRKMLQHAETERDLQTERASEHQAALQEEIAQSKIKVSTLREELASLRAVASAKELECEKFHQERDALQVEFRSYKEHHGTSNQQQMEAITELRLTVDKLSKQVECTKAELHNQQGNLSRHQGYIQSLESQLACAECTRRELHNVIQELKGNIRVFCRVRPQTGNQQAATQHLQIAENKLNLDYMNELHGFSFDRVFSESSSQEAIFEEVGGLVQSALDGFKVSIFAYGQTGSGKTYTMQGSSEPGALGLIPRSVQQILKASEAMRASGWAWTLKVSFLEVYNEVLRDLLGSDGSQLVHVIKHDDAWGTCVTNLTLMEVSHMEQISKLMETAARARSVGATEMNASSSRSHSIFALYLHGINREQHSELHGALHLVDLAGSERLDKSGSTGDRLKETQNINRSLSSLADVFLAKAEGRSHIPFRNSKLIHDSNKSVTFQDFAMVMFWQSFSPSQGKTLMLVTVSPEADHSHETLCQPVYNRWQAEAPLAIADKRKCGRHENIFKVRDLVEARKMSSGELGFPLRPLLAGRSKNEKEPEWDPTFEPLMKVLLGKKGIKTKTASEVGRKKVDYFRGKDFKKFLLESEGILTKKCPKALEEALDGQVPQTDQDVVRLGQELIDRKFCYKAMYKPLNPTSKSDDGAEKKPKKWPDRLGRTPNQTFDSEGFYVITYEGGSGLQHFLLGLIIAGVLLACMFPVWPMWAKVGVWYLSVIFLTLYFGVLILRMLIFTMFWIVGFDFWIFPNLNDEYCGFLDSFQPLYSWEKRKDDALMLLVRFGSLGIAAVAIQQIAETTSFEDVQDLVTSSYADVLAWGVDKLTALPGSEKQALPSVEELQKEKDMEENETNVTADLADEDDDKDDDAAQGSGAPQEQVHEEEAAKEETQDDSS
ncbi:KIN14N [Symbiodinium sp. CCMP2456]|nr:KIN14N [Symbiodinium sp. CCMP2456]